MYVHTRERDSRPGLDGVKIKLLLLLFTAAVIALGSDVLSIKHCLGVAINGSPRRAKTL